MRAIIGLGGDGLVVISIEFLEEGRRPPRDVLLANWPDHAFPTGDALSFAHGKCVTDRLGHFELVIWINNQSCRELLRRPGKFGERINSPGR